ncbi:hypothetical protein DA2_3038 [Desulfovibrio sp. A2]|nr:hypothetical protein DA2_3038 [Desulfovibrio sp. A2]
MNNIVKTLPQRRPPRARTAMQRVGQECHHRPTFFDATEFGKLSNTTGYGKCVMFRRHLGDAPPRCHFWHHFVERKPGPGFGPPCRCPPRPPARQRDTRPS